jgi:hypothetical protein
MPSVVNTPLVHQRPNHLSDFYEVQNRGLLKKVLSKREFRENLFNDRRILLKAYMAFCFLFFDLFRFIKPEGSLCLVVNITLSEYYAKLIKTFFEIKLRWM